MFEVIRDLIGGGGLRRLVTSSVLAVFVAAAGAAKADLVRDFLEIESGYIPHLLSKETPVPPVDYQRVYEDRYEEEWQDDCGQDWIDAIEIHGTTNVTFTGSSSTGWVRTDYNECYRRVETRHEGDSIYDYTFAFETNGTEKIEYWDTISPRHIKCEGWWSFHNAFGDDLEGNEQSESYYDKSIYAHHHGVHVW